MLMAITHMLMATTRYQRLTEISLSAPLLLLFVVLTSVPFLSSSHPSHCDDVSASFAQSQYPPSLLHELVACASGDLPHPASAFYLGMHRMKEGTEAHPPSPTPPPRFVTDAQGTAPPQLQLS